MCVCVCVSVCLCVCSSHTCVDSDVHVRVPYCLIRMPLHAMHLKDIDFGEGIVSKGGLLSVFDFNQQSGTVEVDTTIYTGDYTCVPADTETLAKYNTHYNVKYGAPSGSKFNRGGHLVEFNALPGKNLFQFDYPANFTGTQAFFGQLNQQCKCGHPWTPNATRTVDQKRDCSTRDKALTSDFSDICNVILGNTYYTTILWRDSEHFWLAEGAKLYTHTHIYIYISLLLSFSFFFFLRTKER